SRLTASQLTSFAEGLLVSGAAVAVSYIAAFLLAKALKIRPGRRGIFINTFANANTIFIGMPLNTALFGSKSMEYFLVYYVINTVSTWAFGSFLITNDPMEATKTKQKKDVKEILKKIFSLPLIAFLIAMAVVLLKIKLPVEITTTTQYLGNLVTPLALIYIGIVLSNAGLKSLRLDRDTGMALLGKFVIAPAAMICMLLAAQRFGLSLPAAERGTLIMQSAVPALTVLPVLANDGKGDVNYATNIVALSTILFIVVAPIMMLIINAL
ncbi:AEC family transporter, partial [Lactobacillus nasalidis]|uniref:AEC family transporter n=1 Tax=Lactobacillus nasalidis TaxID=2797258 RepID=UPI002456863D